MVMYILLRNILSATLHKKLVKIAVFLTKVFPLLKNWYNPTLPALVGRSKIPGEIY